MTYLQKLIDTALILSQNLEKAASEEKRFCVDICMELERMSWQTMCLSNDLDSIRSYL